jgi:DNA repair protein RecN (Recombination protein N)
LRNTAARALAQSVTALIHDLGMEGGRFEVQVAHDAERPFRPSGQDEVQFLVSANPGQVPKILAKVASGGELSRISLAIKVALIGTDDPVSMIFDEVDSGVGGAIAQIVGEKLRAVAAKRQVFCVTHLPQVASQAHHHYRVEKSSQHNQTSTAVLALGVDERLEEVARMLGGVTITEQTRAHASEMIATGD